MLSTPTDTTCIRCTSTRKVLQYHGLAVRINSKDDGATSSKNLVNFCLVTLEMSGLICVLLYLYWVKIDLTPAFVVLPFRNATEYSHVCINSSRNRYKLIQHHCHYDLRKFNFTNRVIPI